MASRQTLLALCTLAVLSLQLVEAQDPHPGRIPCGTTAPQQSVCDQLVRPVSRRAMRIPLDSECVEDVRSGMYFCGFQGAACTEDSQCDFGRCSTNGSGEEGICLGGVGDSCEGPEGPDDSLCLGNVGCSGSGRSGVDGAGHAPVCGGVSAECLYTSGYIPGDIPNHSACVSGHCDANTLTCSARPLPNPSRPRIELSQAEVKKESLRQKKKSKAAKQAAQRLQQEKLALEQQRLAAQPAYDDDEDFESSYQRIKAEQEQQFEANEGEISAPSGSDCPRGFTLCPIARGVANSGRFDFGCFDTRTSVGACGGCAGVPDSWAGKKGVDCLSIPGVVSSACVDSQCRVFSCSSNYEFDRRTGTCKRSWYAA